MVINGNPPIHPAFAACSGDLLTAKPSDLEEYCKAFVSVVQTKHGAVDVVTAESPGEGCFNTYVVPSGNYSGGDKEKYDGATILQETFTIDVNLKGAAKTHKEWCRGLDLHNRPYRYDHTLKGYVPVDKEQEQRELTSRFTTAVGAPLY